MNEHLTQPDAPDTTTTTYVVPRRTIRIAMPDGWARALLAGIEGALIAWALTTLSVVATYASVAQNPWMGKMTWEVALALGTDLLGVVLGAPFTLAGVTYWATPTLIGLAFILIMRGLLVPSHSFPVASYWFTLPGFTLTSIFVVGSASYVRWQDAILGAILIPLIAAAWAYMSISKPLERWRLPQWVRAGLVQGLWLLAIIVTLGVVALTLALATSGAAMRDIHAVLLTDSALSDTLVTLAQVGYAPSLIAWALAWLAGPGIILSADALASPVSAPSGPLPPFPVLGAVPTATPGYWVILIPIAVGLAVGAFFGIRRARAAFTHHVGTAAIAATVFTAGTFAWFASAVLHLGTQRMAVLGPRPFSSAAALAAECALSFALAAVLSHPKVSEWAREQWKISRQSPSSTPSDAQTSAPKEGKPDQLADSVPDAAADALGEEATDTAADTLAGSGSSHPAITSDAQAAQLLEDFFGEAPLVEDETSHKGSDDGADASERSASTLGS